MVDRQGLNHKGLVVLQSDEFKHPFIDRPTYRKAETRIESVTHIRKILMREQLQQHGGDSGGTCLKIGLVPHTSSRPGGFVQAADILHNFCLDQIRQIS